MRARLILSVGLATLAVAACKAPAEKAEAEAVVVAAPVAPTAPAVTATSADAPATLEDACRAAVNRLYGQEGTAVTFEPSGANAATVTWRAPVDGGRLTFQCSADGDQVSLSHESRQVSVNLSNNAVAPAAQQEAR